MVWNTIKAVYGYAIDVTTLDDFEDFVDNEGFISWGDFCDRFENIKHDLNCTPDRITQLKSSPSVEGELIKIYPPAMNGDGIAVGTRPLGGPFGGKLVNCWASRDIMDTSYDYSIPEFQHYTGKGGFHYYNLLHRYHCCSNSMKKYAIIGVMYDEVDRNLFLDNRFDEICDRVFNRPTKIEDIDDTFFQHDIRTFTSPKNSKYGEYVAEIRSDPSVRKQELLSPDHSIRAYVDSFVEHYPNMGTPACYLMLDDCTFCT